MVRLIDDFINGRGFESRHDNTTQSYSRKQIIKFLEEKQREIDDMLIMEFEKGICEACRFDWEEIAQVPDAILPPRVQRIKKALLKIAGK